jgi:uncharacterized membrane protein
MSKISDLKVEVFDILRAHAEVANKLNEVAGPLQTQLQELEKQKNEKLKELADEEAKASK